MKLMQFTAFLILFYSSLCGQEIKLYDEEVGRGNHVLFADNLASIPYTVSIHLKLRNATSEKGNKIDLVIDGNTSRQEITKIYGGKGRYSLGYNYEYMEGSVLSPHHDEDALYQIPFDSSRGLRISQGYNGKLSHKNRKAIDFDIPSGTKILAARSGKVIRVKEDSNRGCNSKKCINDANYINIEHEDGSIATYAHLMHLGAEVEVGQYVTQGEMIGYSGNTGYSSLPHLHFEVFLPIDNKEYGVETTFLVNGKPKQLGK